jgi:hypothetical protein
MLSDDASKIGKVCSGFLTAGSSFLKNFWTTKTLINAIGMAANKIGRPMKIQRIALILS